MLLSALFTLTGVCFFLVLRVQGVGGSFPPPLSEEEERDALLRLRQGERAAEHILVEHNLRLVAHIVKKYYADRNEEDDLISIGTIGLMKAVRTFRADRSIRLATYASKCIQNELLMYFRQKKKTTGEVSLSDSLEREDGGDLKLMDVICCDDVRLREVENADRYDAMFRAISTVLQPRERTVLRLRYGLGIPRPLTQREVAAKLGISRSYVSRIETHALGLLRQALSAPASPIP